MTFRGLLRRHVWISGRVQGVGYRQSCAAAARAVGVAGWVRNTADGGVEAVFEGAERAVASMVAWCRQGPAGADVGDVDVRSEEPERLEGFAIRR